MARANIPCRQCHKLHEKQVYADICCLPKRQEQRRAMMELACRGLSTATLTALADAGGVKRVLELLATVDKHVCHYAGEYPNESDTLAYGALTAIRALLEKLGGVE